jgi:biotin/methionine sulfoxide reductase
VSRQRAAAQDIELPEWETFQRDGWFRVPAPAKQTVMLSAFRDDPTAHPLDTPSGRIEIFSETIAGFGYADCPGHPVWLEPAEWLGNAGAGQLHLISNQPRNKLHSQLDHGPVSQADRLNGHEPVLMHPDDAEARGLNEGQIVSLRNRRGACLCEVRLTTDIRPGVVQVATGAWFDPSGDQCTNGNPNALTLDKGTSSLAQGPVAHTCLIEIFAQAS